MAQGELSSHADPDVITPARCTGLLRRLSASHLHSHTADPTNLHSIRLMLPEDPSQHDTARAEQLQPRQRSSNNYLWFGSLGCGVQHGKRSGCLHCPPGAEAAAPALVKGSCCPPKVHMHLALSLHLRCCFSHCQLETGCLLRCSFEGPCERSRQTVKTSVDSNGGRGSVVQRTQPFL